MEWIKIQEYVVSKLGSKDMYQSIKKMGNHKPDVKIQSKLETLYINKREQLTKRYIFM